MTSTKALNNFKSRIRQLTRCSCERSMAQVVQKLRPYLLGWRAYFGMAQTPKVWRELDEWLRHRLRAIQLKHWKSSRPCGHDAMCPIAPCWPCHGEHKCAASSRPPWHTYRSTLGRVQLPFAGSPDVKKPA